MNIKRKNFLILIPICALLYVSYLISIKPPAGLYDPSYHNYARSIDTAMLGKTRPTHPDVSFYAINAGLMRSIYFVRDFTGIGRPNAEEDFLLYPGLYIKSLNVFYTLLYIFLIWLCSIHIFDKFNSIFLGIVFQCVMFSATRCLVTLYLDPMAFIVLGIIGVILVCLNLYSLNKKKYQILGAVLLGILCSITICSRLNGIGIVVLPLIFLTGIWAKVVFVSSLSVCSALFMYLFLGVKIANKFMLGNRGHRCGFGADYISNIKYIIMAESFLFYSIIASIVCVCLFICFYKKIRSESRKIYLFLIACLLAQIALVLVAARGMNPITHYSNSYITPPYMLAGIEIALCFAILFEALKYKKKWFRGIIFFLCIGFFFSLLWINRIQIKNKFKGNQLSTLKRKKQYEDVQCVLASLYKDAAHIYIGYRLSSILPEINITLGQFWRKKMINKTIKRVYPNVYFYYYNQLYFHWEKITLPEVLEKYDEVIFIGSKKSIKKKIGKLPLKQISNRLFLLIDNYQVKMLEKAYIDWGNEKTLSARKNLFKTLGALTRKFEKKKIPYKTNDVSSSEVRVMLNIINNKRSISNSFDMTLNENNWVFWDFYNDIIKTTSNSNYSSCKFFEVPVRKLSKLKLHNMKITTGGYAEGIPILYSENSKWKCSFNLTVPETAQYEIFVRAATKNIRKVNVSVNGQQELTDVEIKTPTLMVKCAYVKKLGTITLNKGGNEVCIFSDINSVPFIASFFFQKIN